MTVQYQRVKAKTRHWDGKVRAKEILKMKGSVVTMVCVLIQEWRDEIPSSIPWPVSSPTWTVLLGFFDEGLGRDIFLVGILVNNLTRIVIVLLVSSEGSGLDWGLQLRVMDQTRAALAGECRGTLMESNTVTLPHSQTVTLTHSHTVTQSNSQTVKQSHSQTVN